MSTLEQVKEVRKRSGVGINACQKALEESGGDVEKALELLQKRGEIKAADRAGRLATEGVIHTYVHDSGTKVAVVEINCETDFAAKSDDFKAFCESVAMQIIASNPIAVARSSVPASLIDTQAALFRDQMPTGIDEDRQIKILEGKLNKFYAEACLLEQESVVEPKKTVDQLRTALMSRLGENVSIRRFIRWEVGEGL